MLLIACVSVNKRCYGLMARRASGCCSLQIQALAEGGGNEEHW